MSENLDANIDFHVESAIYLCAGLCESALCNCVRMEGSDLNGAVELWCDAAAILNPPASLSSSYDLFFDFGGRFGVYQGCHEGLPIWKDEIGGDRSDVFEETFSCALGLAGLAP